MNMPAALLLARVVVFATLAWWLFPACPAQDADAFRAGLRNVRRLTEKAQGTKSLALLESLLKEHSRKNYVRARRQEVAILHRRAAFRAALKPPSIASVVSGKLEKYRAASGKIRITYTADQLSGDFKKSGHRVWISSAAFSGPFSITIKHDDYTRTVRRLILCIGDRASSVVRCTFRVDKDGGEVHLQHIGLDRTEHYSLKATIISAYCKRRWTACIKVTGRKVIFQMNGRQIVSIPGPKNQFGHFGLEQARFKTLTLDGPIEPSWIQGKLDGALDEQRQKFAASYSPRRELPRWLFLEPVVKDPGLVWPQFPVTLSAADARELGRLRHEIRTGRPESASRLVDALRAGEADPLLKAWLSALHYEKVERLADAAKCLDEVLSGNPTFRQGLERRAKVLAAIGRGDRAIADLRKLLQLAPERPETYHALAKVYLSRGEVEEAMIVLDDAFGRATDLSSLEMTRALALKRIYGPDWPRIFEYKTANYHVVSDIDQQTCYEAARVLEGGYRQYRVHLKWVQHAKAGRFPVYLFSGQNGYLNYTKNVYGVSPTRSAGLYNSLLKQLLVWNLPSREAMMRTVRHEGFHQYLDRIMSRPPTWLNEGLAVYYETAVARNGRWSTGMVRRDLLGRLQKSTPSLSYLLSMPPQNFYAGNASRNYAHAWAFVHFLLHGPKRNQKLFERLFKALQEDSAGAAKILDSGVLQALQPEFNAYLEKLRQSG